MEHIKLYCPILSIMNPDVDCTEEKCAWYDEELNMCCIKSGSYQPIIEIEPEEGQPESEST